MFGFYFASRNDLLSVFMKDHFASEITIACRPLYGEIARFYFDTVTTRQVKLIYTVYVCFSFHAPEWNHVHGF